MSSRRRFLICAVAVLAALAIASWHGRHQAAPGRATPMGLRTLWHWDAPAPSYVGMPAADPGGVAFTYGRHRLVLVGTDGRLRWQLEREGLFDATPLLAPDVVAAAADDGVVLVERASGRVRADVRLGERATTPTRAGGLVVATTWEGSFVAVDATRARVAWRVALGGRSLAPATADGPSAVAAWESDDGVAAGLVAVDAPTGATRWKVPLEPGGVGGPAVVPADAGFPALVVVVAGDDRAHAFELASGRERWSAAVDGAGSPEVPALPLRAGRVLVADRQGGLALFDAEGRSLWHASSDGAAVRGGPVGPGPDGRFAFPLDDGRLVVAGPGREGAVVPAGDGRISGVAVVPGARPGAPARALVLATREGTTNRVVAFGPP